MNLESLRRIGRRFSTKKRLWHSWNKLGFSKAEIDIIAQKDNTLVAVEVKTRSSIDFGLPQDFVKPKKIQLLVKAINEYVVSNDLDVEVQFDIIAVNKEEKDFNIEHIKNAFFHFWWTIHKNISRKH